jgi:hypothetical protein
MAVFEIPKPAFRGAIDFSDNHLQALPVVAFGLSANRIFELLETLASWPSLTTFEVIPKKVETTGLRGINDPRLLWM